MYLLKTKLKTLVDPTNRLPKDLITLIKRESRTRTETRQKKLKVNTYLLSKEKCSTPRFTKQTKKKRLLKRTLMAIFVSRVSQSRHPLTT